MRLPAVAWLAAALCIVAAAMIYAKVAWVGLPLKPDATSAVWTVEARASFYAQGNVKARLALPSNPPGFEVLDEDFVVRDFGLAEELDGGQRYALLSARRVAGPPRRPRRRQGGAPGRPSVAAPRRPDGRVAALWPQLPEVDGRPAPSSWAGTGAGDRDGRGPLLYNRAPAPVIRRSARSLSSVPTPLPAHYWELPITYKLSTGLSLPRSSSRRRSTIDKFTRNY